jgi:hypothetical protein
VIEGGYYDNYGVASVLEWLDEAFTARIRAPEVRAAERPNPRGPGDSDPVIPL